MPALDTGSKTVVESLDIADYLDEEYPNPPLYPAEPHAREADKTLIRKIDSLTSIFYKILIGAEQKSAADWLKDLTPHLEVFESELEKRGSKFFGGDQPGMVKF